MKMSNVPFCQVNMNLFARFDEFQSMALQDT